MREIKFRAWDKANRCMIGDDDSEADFKFYGGGVTVRYCSEEFYEGGGEIHSRDRWEDCDVEIMQYTGLKDKNGKEIYEGDIVRVPVGETEVTFSLGCFYTIFNGSNYRLGGWQNKIEVIGNIYENTELLSNEQNDAVSDTTGDDSSTDDDKIK